MKMSGLACTRIGEESHRQRAGKNHSKQLKVSDSI